MASAALLLLCLATSLSSFSSAFAPPRKLAEATSAAEPGWYIGRASWYGTPKPFVSAFSSYRAESAFGILPWGGCGYSNINGADAKITYPVESVGAYSDVNEDSPGSCGRCYELRCREGLVLGWQDQPVPISQEYAYYPGHGSAPDDQGRAFPGNPSESQGQIYVKCWDPTKSIRIRIIDVCPCIYCPKFGPSANKCFHQERCCYTHVDDIRAGQNQFDLSYWAFEQLAHPMYPEMMLEYRPVDCDTGATLPRLPGYISRTLYSGGPGTGWSWNGVKHQSEFEIAAAGEGAHGDAAACATVGAGGGMYYWCRECDQHPAGSRPFDGVKTISFKIKSKSNPGEVPNMQVSLSQLPAPWSTGVDGDALNPGVSPKPCGASVGLRSLTPSSSSGDYKQFDIPLADFKCGSDVVANKLDVLQVDGGDYRFCMDDVQLLP